MNTRPLSATIERVEDILYRTRADLEAFVATLVGIDSQIPPYSDEREIAHYLTDAMSGLGLPPAETVARIPSRPNLVARIPGTGAGRSLLLNGHIDTKPIGDARAIWRTDPLVATRIGPNLFGLGIADMKAAVGCMIYAAHAIRAAGLTLKGDLILAFVADEEAGAEYGAKYLAPTLRGAADACLIGEPSGWERDWQGTHLVSRGLCAFQVRVTGTQMHSSLSDRMPSVNANVEMARLVLRLRADFAAAFPASDPDEPAPTLNVAVTARGGVYYGVVPGEATFGCDLRTVPGMTEAGVRSFFDTWAAEQTAKGPSGVGIEYDDVLHWIPSSQIDPAHDLVAAVRGASAAVLGQVPPSSVFPGATDAPWFDAAGIPTLPSFGPGILTHCHGPNEFVRVDALHEAARMYARTVMAFCQIEDD
jgi:acetylornithine deacetylase/succinyl-diaminopimelate desuccinylase-like protein